jgi:hypothetical protein
MASAGDEFEKILAGALDRPRCGDPDAVEAERARFARERYLQIGEISRAQKSRST